MVNIESVMMFAQFKSGDGQPVAGTGRRGNEGRQGGKHKDEHGHGKPKK